MALTVVYAYYDNSSMLELHIQEWKKYQDKIQIIVVDDASPNFPAFEILKDKKLNLELYRVKKNIPWNQNGARNLAMQKCGTEWALMLDMDHLLPAEDASYAVRKIKVPGFYYVPRRIWPDGAEYKRHPNSFLLTKEDFWNCGGYDEDFCGFYGSDAVFRAALDTVAKRIETNTIKTIHFEGIVKDANTKGFFGDGKIRKGSKYHSVNHRHLLKKRRSIPYKAENHIRFEYERLL